MKKEKFTVWDMADNINTPEDVFAYLEGALEENDPQFLLKVLGYIARSKGMALLAKEQKISYDNVLTAATAANTLNGLGFQVTIQPKAPIKSAIKKRKPSAAHPKIAAAKKTHPRKVATRV